MQSSRAEPPGSGRHGQCAASRGADVTIADRERREGRSPGAGARRASNIRAVRRHGRGTGRGCGAAGRSPPASCGRRLLRRRRLGRADRVQARTASADAVRDGAAGEPDRHLQRPAVRGRGDERSRSPRRRRAWRVHQHRFDRGLRRADRADRLLGVQGRHRGPDAAGARDIASRGIRVVTICARHVRHAVAPERSRRRPATSWDGDSRSPSAWASPPSSRRWPCTSSRTRC